MKSTQSITQPNTMAELVALLDQYRIPHSTWGAGEAKTLGHLLQEVRSREAVLETKNDILFRATMRAGVDVRYAHPELGKLILVEERQVFTDGRSRVRKGLIASLVEKMSQDEHSAVAAERALKEEIGLTYRDFWRFHPRQPKLEACESPSFPGLWGRAKAWVYDFTVPPKDFKPEGYVERQKDKSTYFVWKPE